MSAHSPGIQGVFVTGTDTGVGKTRVSLALMEALKQKGLQVSGMKPVATGCYPAEDGLRNEDAVLLRAHASVPLDYDSVNPYAFAPPVSPHIAAIQAGREICLDLITRQYGLLRAQSQFVIVEGAGGWEVPLNSAERVSDLARILGLPVLLVVGLRLGCLNHALLTASAIRNSGCDLIGWVGNRIDPAFPCVKENITTLSTGIPAPLVGLIPFGRKMDARKLAGCFELDHWTRE
ncbi:MAG: dethiobiotin synthase [Methylococcaceae bacterium]|nr:dethiobiotin synthase [Methylococcaceae bacterium]MCI0734168.1 dethiobiotin synthase [Methylococcaceae bacterium]